MPVEYDQDEQRKQAAVREIAQGRAKPAGVRMRYRNWRGEVSIRTITPISIRWGATEWHSEPQWLLRAYDHDKQDQREFALGECDFRLNTLKSTPND